MGQSTLADALSPMLQAPDIRQLYAMPVLYLILEALGLRDEINALRPSKADIELGCIALLLILNRMPSKPS